MKKWSETLTCPSRHQVAKQRIHALRRAYQAGESSDSLRRDIFRIVNSEDSTNLSGDLNDDQIKEVKHKVWFEQKPNDVSEVVKLTEDIWERVNKQERGAVHADYANPLCMASSKPVNFNDNLDWQFNKRRAEVYFDKQQ